MTDFLPFYFPLENKGDIGAGVEEDSKMQTDREAAESRRSRPASPHHALQRAFSSEGGFGLLRGQSFCSYRLGFNSFSNKRLDVVLSLCSGLSTFRTGAWASAVCKHRCVCVSV